MSGGCVCSKHIEKRFFFEHFFSSETFLQSWSCDLDHFVIVVSTPSIYYNLIYYVCDHLKSCFSCCPFLTLNLTVQQPFHFFFNYLSYHVFVYWARYIGNCIYLGQTIPVPCKLCVQKLLMTTFSSSLLFFINNNFAHQ